MANRVSNDQLEELLDFLAEHPALAKGVGLGARSKETVDKQWDSLATKLNAYGSGSSKPGDRWKKYWANIKHKTKARLAKRRRDALGTGGGPSSQDDLSETDRKILAIIGEQAIHGDREHRIPFFSNEFPEHGISQEILITGNIAENVPVTVVSPSTRGQTCRLRQHTSEIPEIGSPTKKVSETSIPEPVPLEIPVTGLESPVARPHIDRPHKRKRPYISNTVQSRIDPEWIKELESRRVEAETKLAEAALIMAESSRTQAEVAKVQADMMKTLVDLIHVQNQDVRALMELTRVQAGILTNQNLQSNSNLI